ncbi:MAG: LysR family transcriptional regulator [Anaerolineae bacterium]|nr:LysR family transcriptional regulator [Anaerolineae bacterium]
MEPKLNVWLEVEGEVVLSVWRVELLTAVSQTGSISAAAAHMGVPYRIAWQKIHEMESRLGQKLVETQTGGKHGGGASLTPLAQNYIDRFTQISQELDAVLQERFQAIFLPNTPE